MSDQSYVFLVCGGPCEYSAAEIIVGHSLGPDIVYCPPKCTISLFLSCAHVHITHTPELHYLSLHSERAMSRLLLLLLPLTVGQAPAEPPRGCLDTGACYTGSWKTTSKGNQFASFQGIRYAQPPVAEKRFLSPQGEYDVSVESSIVCPQKTVLTAKPFGDEDCLVLNIYVPNAGGEATPDLIPVMVWIHGGGLREVKAKLYSWLIFLSICKFRERIVTLAMDRNSFLTGMYTVWFDLTIPGMSWW